MSMGISIVSFTVCMLAVVFLSGDLLIRYIGWKRSIVSALAWGMALLFALSEIIAYPLFLLNSSFTLFFWIYSAAIAAVVLCSVFFIIKDRPGEYFDELRSFIKNIKASPFVGIVLLFVFALFLVKTFMYYPDRYTGVSDDAYYMPRAMEVIKQNSLSVSHSFAWVGYETDIFPDTTDASTLEFFKAYLSYVSGIHVTVFCRWSLLFVLAITHISALLLLADEFIKQNANKFVVKSVFIILYLLSVVLSSVYHQHTAANWMTNLLWHGKSILPALIFPLMLYAAARLCKNNVNSRNREWLSAAVILLAGISVSITGLFLVPLYYALLGFSFILSQKFKECKNTLINATVAALPVIIIVIISYLEVVNVNTQYFTDFEELRTLAQWGEKMRMAIPLHQFILLSGAVAYMIYKGSRKQRVFLLLPILVLILTFLNPFLIYYVSQYITTSEVYWRLVWMIPVSFLPAFAVAEMTEYYLGSRIKGGIILVAALLGFAMIPHYFTGWEDSDQFVNAVAEHGIPRTNKYCLDEDTIFFCDAILADNDSGERPNLLTIKAPFYYEVRVYTAEINMVGGIRANHKQKNNRIISGTDVTEGEFYSSFNWKRYIYHPKKLHYMLTEVGADYVLINVEKTPTDHSDFQENGFKFICESNNMELWKVKK